MEKCESYYDIKCVLSELRAKYGITFPYNLNFA